MSWKSKHAQVVETLRGLLLGGEWHDVMPGYRTLEEILRVSRPTIEKALAELTEEGLLAEAEMGKSRRILAVAPPVIPYAHTKALLILGFQPVAELPWCLQHFLGSMSNSAREEGWRVTYDDFAFQHFKNPGGHLERLMKNHHPDRLLLILPTVAVATWLQSRGIPFFCLGGAILDMVNEIDGTGTARTQLVGLAARHLVEKGHNRILYPIAPMYRRSKEVQVDMAMEWGLSLRRSEIERLMPIRKSIEPEAIHAEWRKWFWEMEPTAVLVQYHRDLLSLVGFCNKAGIRIPKDLSVISLSWEPSLRWMNPEVTGVEHPVESCVKWATRWLRLPAGERLGWRMLDGHLLPGGTVGPPRQQAVMIG